MANTDFLYIGSSPCGEDCIQVGSEDYVRLSKIECREYINQIRRVYGEEPESARLSVHGQPHDFGTYYEVICRYMTGSEIATNYAFDVEGDPKGELEFWDEQAIEALEKEGIIVNDIDRH